MAKARKNGQSASARAVMERPRLVDHFKRAYQIVVGLAITLACTKVFPSGAPDFLPPDISFWLFGIFFVTIVPIFHGGDRSLDIKYLHQSPRANWMYLFDVYVLLITAILFVKVAQALPIPKGISPIINVPAPTTPDLFYLWMAYLLGFDVVALVLDRLKSESLPSDQRQKLNIYLTWIIANAILAIACFCAWYFTPLYLGWERLVAFGIFLMALVRTMIDYWAGRDFMFP